ncbi:HAD family hydrolase [Kiritimatiellaeota bacterium B1221]|nr:HAD family hydrolase [Kiritimatiellaeota bacterium B1221]
MKTIALLCFAACTSSLFAQDLLPSWNEGETKGRILKFISEAQTEGSDGYIAPGDRIATFDNDGNLWSEKPMYFQLIFIMERVAALAPEHPEWKTQQPFQAVLEGDKAAMKGFGEKELLELMAATHAGMTEEEFSEIVSEWMQTAKHPTAGKLYTEMTFQPMKELLQALRDAGFKTYIVSGGGISFMRPWVEAAYGIPPEQVVGSRIKVEYEEGGKIRRLGEIDLIDDKAGKPVGIYQVIGKRPVLASGNSDGDFQMLEYATTGEGARLGLILHHTDADREWAYDRESHVGQLSRGLDEAAARGWIVIDMAKDWKTIYGE